MILETPIDRPGKDGKTVEDKGVWAEEIKLLESLIGMDTDGDEFQEKEAELARRGAGERSKFQDQMDRKVMKNAKKGSGGAKKGRKRKKADTDDEDSE